MSILIFPHARLIELHSPCRESKSLALSILIFHHARLIELHSPWRESKSCIQYTLSSRAALRPSASREQSYLAYKSKSLAFSILIFTHVRLIELHFPWRKSKSLAFSILILTHARLIELHSASCHESESLG